MVNYMMILFLHIGFFCAFCNFVFPRPIGRPMPGAEAVQMAAEEFSEGMKKIIDDVAKNKLDEDELDAATADERIANVDGRYTEDDRKDLESGKKIYKTDTNKVY